MKQAKTTKLRCKKGMGQSEEKVRQWKGLNQKSGLSL